MLSARSLFLGNAERTSMLLSNGHLSSLGWSQMEDERHLTFYG